MPVNNFISIVDLGVEPLHFLVDRSVELASDSNKARANLTNKVVGIHFRIPSTRTRTSFTVGALKLGAHTITLGPNDLQLTTGETLEDTARVLSEYIDALVIRTNESMAEMKILARQSCMAVINAMSENEHPTQAIADLSTIKAHFGRLAGIHILYMGEGNNTAAALALAVAHFRGMKITFVTPKGYGLSKSTLETAQRCASRHGAIIEHQHEYEMDKLPRRVDAVYTSRWQTMGVPHEEPHWRDKFGPYSVTQNLMDRVSKSTNTIFLHDLPAVCGDEISRAVLDGPQSLAWAQARNKMFSAMSILEWCLTGK